MAKILNPPVSCGNVPGIVHPYDINVYNRACDNYVRKVREWAVAQGNSEFAGEEIRFGVADGYARYIVVSLKPAILIHLPLGDAYQFEYAHRLKAVDIKECVRRHQAMARLFNPKKK